MWWGKRVLLKVINDSAVEHGLLHTMNSRVV